MRILVVDDNNGYRSLLRRILEAQQDMLLVLGASDGEEGVRLAEQFKPDIVLMDIELHGTNGAQAARRIKESLPDTAVLLLSALDSDSARERAAECGADAYLVKTVSIAEILKTIRRMRPTKAA